MTKPNQQKLREMAKRYPWIIDGDKTDFRFADPPAALVTLHNKGNLSCVQEGKYLLRDTHQINQYLSYIATLQDDLPAPQIPITAKKPTRKKPTRTRTRTQLPIKSKRKRA